jgi:hypothetical protein
MNVIFDFKGRACLVLTLALLVGQAFSAHAQTVLIDMNNGDPEAFRGLSVPNPDSNGNYWNSLRGGVFYQNLIDLHNAPTTIDFGFSTPVATDSFNGPAGPTSAATLHTDVLFTDIDQNALGNMGGSFEAAFDYAASPGPTTPLTGNKVRFEIQQLDPSKKYDLSFFGSHEYEGDVTTVYSVYSDNTYSTVVGTVNLNVRDPDPNKANLHNRDTIATISNLSPQTGNIFYVEFVGSTGNLGYLNELRIVGTTAVVTGDYNGNGKVDAADYVLWRKNPSAFGGDPGGYNTWRASFGNPPGAGSAFGETVTAVPEPGSLILAVAAAVGLLSLNRRG